MIAREVLAGMLVVAALTGAVFTMMDPLEESTITMVVHNRRRLGSSGPIEDPMTIHFKRPLLAMDDSQPAAASVPDVQAPESAGSAPWPGVPVEYVGAPLVKKGKSFVDDAAKLFFRYKEDFIYTYDNRPDKVNNCGMRINHIFALYTTLLTLKPTTIIESGVNAGQGTFFMRAISSRYGEKTKILSFDPSVKPICNHANDERWTDTSPHTKYYTGKDFVDITEMDWAGMIERKEIDPATTLVFIDDHQNVFDRLAVLFKHGFRHVLLEDNYKLGEGVMEADKSWGPKQLFSASDAPTNPDTQFLFNNLKTYAEFPPLVAPAVSKAFTGPKRKMGGFMHHTDDTTTIMPPILRAEVGEQDRSVFEDMANRLKMDPSLKDMRSYDEFMNYNQITYLELAPMSPRMFQDWGMK